MAATQQQDPESFDLAAIVAQLREVREQWRQSQQRPRDLGGRELPSREALSAIALALRGALFPMRLGPPELRQESEDYYVGHTLDTVLSALLTQVRLELRHQARHDSEALASADARSLALVRAFGAACRAFARCSTAMCWPPSTATRQRAASTKCCCATPASTR